MHHYCGELRMEADTGLVDRRVGVDDYGEETWEPCGFVGCDWDCPHGLEADWEILLADWNDAIRAGQAYERTVASSYYDRLTPAHWN